MQIDLQIDISAFRKLKRDIRLYYYSYFFIIFSWAGLTMVLFNLYMLRLGLSTGVIGVVNGTFFLVFSLFSFPAGMLGRRVQIRTLMIAGGFVVIFGFAVILGAESVSKRVVVPLFVVGSTLMGIGAALYVVCSFPFLMTCKPENKNRVFSFRYAIEILGTFTGSLVAGFLPRIWSQVLQVERESPLAYRLSLAVALPFFLVGLYYVFRIGAVELGEENKDEPTQAKATGLPFLPILLVALVTLLTSMGGESVRRFFNVFMDRQFSLPSQIIGIMMGTASILGMPAVAVSAILIKRWGPRRVIRYGLFLSVIWIILFIVSGSVTFAVVGFVLLLATIFLYSPALDLYHQSIVAAEHRSVMAGAYTMAWGLGGSGILFAGGFMISSLGFSWLFTVAAGLMLCGALCFTLFLRKHVVPVDTPQTDS